MDAGTRAGIEQLVAAAEQFVAETGHLESAAKACESMRELIAALRAQAGAPSPCRPRDPDCEEELRALLSSV